MKKTLYTHENLIGDLNVITNQIQKNNYNPTAILGITRGGIIPAALLSQWFNIPLYTYQCSLRDHVNAPANKETLNLMSKYNVLVVDDICDSGETLKQVTDALSPYQCYPRTAVLHYNLGQDIFQPTFYANEINKCENDVWITYYWEQYWKNNE